MPGASKHEAYSRVEAVMSWKRIQETKVLWWYPGSRFDEMMTLTHFKVEGGPDIRIVLEGVKVVLRTGSPADVRIHLRSDRGGMSQRWVQDALRRKVNELVAKGLLHTPKLRFREGVCVIFATFDARSSVLAERAVSKLIQTLREFKGGPLFFSHPHMSVYQTTFFRNTKTKQEKAFATWLAERCYPGFTS